MPSIVDMIAEAEKKADEIKKEAAKKARSIVDAAQTEADNAKQLAQNETKRLLVLRRESAEHSAQLLAKDIISRRRAESKQVAQHARERIDKAVSLIIERVENK